jgi:parvulin-like peptidyl-prolyl isomerase
MKSGQDAGLRIPLRRIILKRRRLFLWVVLVCLLAPATVSGRVIDRIAAVVNDDIIMLSEFESAFDPYQKRLDATYRGPDRDKVIADGRVTVLNRMIDNRLIRQRAKKLGIEVKDDEIMGTLKGMLDRRNLSMQIFEQMLEREGSTLDGYREDMKDQMTRMRLLRRELRAKILISEDEIGEEYIKRRDEYEGREAVRIMQIMLRLPRETDRAARKKVQADAEMIRQRLLDGEPFEALATQYSQGPAAATGGDVGFIEKGAMLPEVDSAAFRLAKNEISDVIASSVGLHIIKVLDKRGAGVKPLESIREEIKAKLEEEKMEKSYDEWIVDLRKRSHIEIKL